MCYFFHKPRIEIEYYSVAYFEWITEFDALLHWASAEGGAHTQCVNAWTSDTVVSCKYALHFGTLASVQNPGEAYTRDATISLAITPSLPVNHDLIVDGGDQAQGGEMLPTLAVGSWALALRGEEVGRFQEVAGMSIVDAGARRSVFAVDTLTVDSRVAFQLRDESSSGGGRAYTWNIPQQDFALKMQEGLYAWGGYLRDTTVHLWSACEPHRS